MSAWEDLAIKAAIVGVRTALAALSPEAKKRVLNKELERLRFDAAGNAKLAKIRKGQKP